MVRVRLVKRRRRRLVTEKSRLKNKISDVTGKINNLKKKTANCSRNKTKKYRYAQIRAALKREVAGKPANLKALTAGQKKRLGPLSQHSNKFKL